MSKKRSVFGIRRDIKYFKKYNDFIKFSSIFLILFLSFLSFQFYVSSYNSDESFSFYLENVFSERSLIGITGFVVDSTILGDGTESNRSLIENNSFLDVNSINNESMSINNSDENLSNLSEVNNSVNFSDGEGYEFVNGSIYLGEVNLGGELSENLSDRDELGNLQNEEGNGSLKEGYELTDYEVQDASGTFNVSFVSPSNGFAQTANSVYVNVSSQNSLMHYTFVDSDNSLLLWMRMDDLNASGDPIDLSSYGNNGSKLAGATQATGLFNKSFAFGADADAIKLPPSLKLSNMSSWTLSAWVYKPSGLDPTRAFQLYLDGGTSFTDTFLISFADHYLGENELSVYSCDNLLYGFGSIVSFVDTWQYVSFVYNGSLFSYYRNGVLVGNSSFSIPSCAGSNVFLGKNSMYDDFVSKNIDDVLIFNRTLSASEIKSLYNASAYQYENNFTNLSSGTHTFRANSVDTSGKKENASLSGYVGSALLVTLSNPVNGNSYFTSSINFNVSTNRNASLNYTLNGGITNYTMIANSTGTGFSASNSSISDGSYNVTFYVKDTFGMVNASVRVSFTIDATSGISAEFVSPTYDNNTITDNTLIFVSANVSSSNFRNITYFLYNSSGGIVSSGSRWRYDSEFAGQGINFCGVLTNGSVISSSFDYKGNDALQCSYSLLDGLCVLKSNGNVKCYSSPSYLRGDAIQVSSGQGFNCILNSQGEVYCYGLVNYNYTGGDAIQVSSRGDYLSYSDVCVLKSNGNVTCSGGYNYTGGDAIQVSSGGGYTYQSGGICVLTSNGNVTCSGGYNYTGGDAIQVSSGWDTLCVLKSNGNTECESIYPSSYDYTGGDAIRVSAGEYQNCVLTVGGQAKCFALGGNTNYSNLRISSYYPFTNLEYENYSIDALVYNFNGNSNRTTLRNIFIEEFTFPLSYSSNTPSSGSSIYGNSFNIGVNYSYNDTHYSFIDLDSSLISWWRFENYSGNEVLDYSGNENILTNSSGAVDLDAEGKFGSSLNFNSSSANAFSTSGLTAPSTEYTYSMWFKTNNSISPFINLYAPSYSPDYYSVPFGLYEGKICQTLNAYLFRFVPEYSYTSRLCSVLTYNDSAWHHVTLTVGSAGTKIYIDGQIVGSNSAYTSLGISYYTGFPVSNSNYFVLGTANYGYNEGTYYYNGNLDEVMIFNRVLTGDEIYELYSSDATFNQTYTGLSYGSHNFKGYVVNTLGEQSSTSLRTVNLINPSSSSSSSSESGGSAISNISLKEGECYDSDGGVNYFSSGVVSMLKNGRYYSYNDYCSGDLIKEFSCSGGSAYEGKYSCTNGCSDGRCISSEKKISSDNLLVSSSVSSGGSSGNFYSLQESKVCGAYLRQSPVFAIPSSSFTGYSALNIIDGNSETGWYGKFDEDYPKAVVFDLGVQKCLRAVDLYVREWDLPIEVDVQVSNDGSDWNTLLHNVSLENPRTIGLAFPTAVVSRYVKIVELSGSRPFGNLQEIKVLATNYSGVKIG